MDGISISAASGMQARMQSLEMLANKLAKHHGDHVEAIKDTMSQLEGSSAFALLMGDELYGVRDPWGIKPLCLGQIPGHGGPFQVKG